MAKKSFKAADSIGFYFSIEDDLDVSLRKTGRNYSKFITEVGKLNTKANASLNKVTKSLADLVSDLDDLPKKFSKAMGSLGKGSLKPIKAGVTLTLDPSDLKKLGTTIAAAVSGAVSGGMRGTGQQYDWQRGTYRPTAPQPREATGRFAPQPPPRRYVGPGADYGNRIGRVSKWLGPNDRIKPKNILDENDLSGRGASGRPLNQKVLQSASVVETLLKGVQNLDQARSVGVKGATGLSGFTQVFKSMRTLNAEMKNLKKEIKVADTDSILPLTKHLSALQAQYDMVTKSVKLLGNAESESASTTDQLLSKILGWERLEGVMTIIDHIGGGLRGLKDVGVGVGRSAVQAITDWRQAMLHINQGLNMSRDQLFGLAGTPWADKGFQQQLQAGATQMFGKDVWERTDPAKQAEALSALYDAGARTQKQFSSLYPITAGIAETTGLNTTQVAQNVYGLSNQLGLSADQITAFYDSIKRMSGALDNVNLEGLQNISNTAAGSTAEPLLAEFKRLSSGGAEQSLANTAALQAALQNQKINLDVAGVLGQGLTDRYGAGGISAYQTLGAMPEDVVKQLESKGGASQILQEIVSSPAFSNAAAQYQSGVSIGDVYSGLSKSLPGVAQNIDRESLANLLKPGALQNLQTALGTAQSAEISPTKAIQTLREDLDKALSPADGTVNTWLNKINENFGGLINQIDELLGPAGPIVKELGLIALALGAESLFSAAVKGTAKGALGIAKGVIGFGADLVGGGGGAAAKVVPKSAIESPIVADEISNSSGGLGGITSRLKNWWSGAEVKPKSYTATEFNKAVDAEAAIGRAKMYGEPLPSGAVAPVEETGGGIVKGLLGKTKSAAGGIGELIKSGIRGALVQYAGDYITDLLTTTGQKDYVGALYKDTGQPEDVDSPGRIGGHFLSSIAGGLVASKGNPLGAIWGALSYMAMGKDSERAQSAAYQFANGAVTLPSGETLNTKLDTPLKDISAFDSLFNKGPLGGSSDLTNALNEQKHAAPGSVLLHREDGSGVGGNIEEYTLPERHMMKMFAKDYGLTPDSQGIYNMGAVMDAASAFKGQDLKKILYRFSNLVPLTADERAKQGEDNPWGIPSLGTKQHDLAKGTQSMVDIGGQKYAIPDNWKQYEKSSAGSSTAPALNLSDFDFTKAQADISPSGTPQNSAMADATGAAATPPPSVNDISGLLASNLFNVTGDVTSTDATTNNLLQNLPSQISAVWHDLVPADITKNPVPIAPGTSGYAHGGIVLGNPSQIDSVPAMLTPGELVLTAKQAAQFTKFLAPAKFATGGVVGVSYEQNKKTMDAVNAAELQYEKAMRAYWDNPMQEDPTSLFTATNANREALEAAEASLQRRKEERFALGLDVGPTVGSYADYKNKTPPIPPPPPAFPNITLPTLPSPNSSIMSQATPDKSITPQAAPDIVPKQPTGPTVLSPPEPVVPHKPQGPTLFGQPVASISPSGTPPPSATDIHAAMQKGVVQVKGDVTSADEATHRLLRDLPTQISTAMGKFMSRLGGTPTNAPKHGSSAVPPAENTVKLATGGEFN